MNPSIREDLDSVKIVAPLSKPENIHAAPSPNSKEPETVEDKNSSQSSLKVPPLRIKLEKGTPNGVSQSQIETDAESSSSDDMIPLKVTKRKRKILDSDSTSEAPAELPRAKKKKSMKLHRSPKKERIRDSTASTSSSRSSLSDGEPKVEAIKTILEKLSHGITEDSHSILKDFESLIGPKGFLNLKSLLMNTSEKNESIEPSDIVAKQVDYDSTSENEALSTFVIKKSPRKTRKKKNEAEKLKEDIEEMFIRDGVLSAHGLRHKRAQYNEDALCDYDFDDAASTSSSSQLAPPSQLAVLSKLSTPSQLSPPSTSIDSDSVNGQKGSSAEETSEKELEPNEVAEPDYKLKEFSVFIQKLPLEEFFVNLMIEDDGNIVVEPEIDQNVCDQEGEPRHEDKKEEIKVEIEDFLSEKSQKIETENSLHQHFFSDEIITIEDDEDIPIANLPQKEGNDIIQTTLLPVAPGTPGISTSKTMRNFHKKVINLSYSLCRGGITFRCKAENCSYVSTIESMFEYHTQTRHLLTKWSGFCEICGLDVSIGARKFGSLYDEFKHMLIKHCKVPTIESVPKNINDEVTKKKRQKSTKRSIKTPQAIQALPSASSSYQLTPPKKPIQTVAPRTCLAIEMSPLKTALTSPIKQIASKSNETINETSSRTIATNSTQLMLPLVAPLNSRPMTNNVQASPTRAYAMLPPPTQPVLPNPMISQNGAVLPKVMLKFRNLPGDKLSSANDSLRLQLGGTSPAKNALAPSTGSAGPAHCQASEAPHFLPQLQNFIATVQQTQVSPPTAPGEATPIVVRLIKTPQGFHHPSPADNHPLKVTISLPKISVYLRPWLSLQDQKDNNDILDMLSQKKLSLRYKCMGSKCNFATENIQEFANHLLSLHQTPHTNDFTWGRCCYCEFSAKIAHELLNHQNNHKNDMFGCTYCFYRSVSSSYVGIHQKSYHASMSLKIMKFSSYEPLNVKQELANTRLNRQKFVSPISCPCCRQKFFVYETFERHFIEAHGKDSLKLKYRCNKCLKESTMESIRYHLENCHNIKHYHCLNCPYGSNNLNAFKIHLINQHPSKVSFFCERVQESAQINHVESIALRSFGVRNA